MLENPITQDNLKTLEHYGFTVIPSGSGLLACGDVGSGRLPEEGVLVDYVLRELACEKDLKGKKVVVSAGATQEPMDPVRYITNHSTGKMGYAVARACMLRGADVTLLASTGCTLPPVPFVKMVPYTTAAELFAAVQQHAMDADALVMAAAVADYRPATVAQDKVKKKDGEMTLALERTQDILAWVGEHKPEKLFVCGFSMETRDLIENSTAKLHKKQMDMIVANNLKVPGAGFGVDTNVVTLITGQGTEALPLQSKDAVAQLHCRRDCSQPLKSGSIMTPFCIFLIGTMAEGGLFMCGIAGQIGRDPRAIQGQYAAYCAMQRTMARRGPDQRGMYISGRAALIHARLAVVDLENGCQPHAVGLAGGELYPRLQRGAVQYNGTARPTGKPWPHLYRTFRHGGPAACLCRVGRLLRGSF